MLHARGMRLVPYFISKSIHCVATVILAGQRVETMI
jgi:hypothetical protein